MFKMEILGGNGFYVVEGAKGSLRINSEYVQVRLAPHDCLRGVEVEGFLMVNSPIDLGGVVSRFGKGFTSSDIPAIEELLDG